LCTARVRYSFLLKVIVLEIIVGNLKYCSIVELAVIPFQSLVFLNSMYSSVVNNTGHSMNVVSAHNLEIMRYLRFSQV
jgi:hypothetical protein